MPRRLGSATNDGNAANFDLRITPLQAGLWEGDVSANWHTPGNWNDVQVPTATVDVTIPPGTPHSPAITTGNGYCRNLTLESGATLTFSTNLYVNADATVYGHLNMNHTWSRFWVEGDVDWEAGSTASLVGSARLIIEGDMNFASGANVKLSTGFTEFTGTGPSWIRSYEANCNLHNLNCSKTGSGYVGISALCVDELHVNNIYNYTGSTLRIHSYYPVVIGGFFNNMGGHFAAYYGTVIFEGAAGTVALKPNTGDYFNDLIIRSASALTLDPQYADSLRIKGDLTLESGGLNANGLDVEVGGNWTNTMGLAGFTAEAGTVSFIGSGVDQTVEGQNAFNHLVDNRTGGGTLTLRGVTTVASNYVVNTVNSIRTNLTVNGTLDLNNPACFFGIHPGATITASKLNLGGRITCYGGAMTADHILGSGLYGQITVEDGEINLHQGTRLFDSIHLNGDLTLNGGQLNVYGGRAENYWPSATNASLTMTDGILDFKDQGIRLRNSSMSFTQYVSGGTIRSTGNFIVERNDFQPAGGMIELYGTTATSLDLAAGSYARDLLIDKGKGGSATATSDLVLWGDFTLASGRFTAPANMSVGGNWSNGVNAAAFIEGTGHVTFMGGALARILTDETFYDLSIDKPYRGLPLRRMYELELNAGSTIQVLRDLAILDGTFELNTGCALNVDRHFTLAQYAGLNANDKAVSLFIGGNWADGNTGYSDTAGFDAGYSSTVTFDGAVDGTLDTAAPEARFYHLRIDRPGGSFRPADSVLVGGNLNLENGSWFYSQPNLTHSFRGNDHCGGGGLERHLDRQHASLRWLC